MWRICLVEIRRKSHFLIDFWLEMTLQITWNDVKAPKKCENNASWSSICVKICEICYFQMFPIRQTLNIPQKRWPFRISLRKNLATRRYFRTFWVLWRPFTLFVGPFRAKNQSRVTFSSYFDQANSLHDMWHPKKTFPYHHTRATYVQHTKKPQLIRI